MDIKQLKAAVQLAKLRVGSDPSDANKARLEYAQQEYEYALDPEKKTATVETAAVETEDEQDPHNQPETPKPEATKEAVPKAAPGKPKTESLERQPLERQPLENHPLKTTITVPEGQQPEATEAK